ncbi:MAG: PAS domain-containing protein [Proteobacteria bacterium]|nr:PAS domain-containing protein [Pseudomonadota bacterium]
MRKSKPLRSEIQSDPQHFFSKVLLTSQNFHLRASHTKEFILKKDEEILFKNFIKKIPAAIAIFDVEMRYIIMSDQFVGETNTPTQDVIGKKLYDVVPDIPKKWRIAHQKGLTGEHLSCDEDSFKRANGNLEWWRWELLPWYKAEGEIGGIILFVEEITKRKIMEKKMKEMIKTLNRSNEELERFAHICAHDLNEPLRTIGNYCQIIEKDFKEGLSVTAKSYFKSITKSVKQMSDLVNGILAYSQFGSPSLKMGFCSTQEIVNSIKMILEKKIKDKKAVIFSDPLPMVYGDRVLLTRVFQNLISNSLKFNENNKPIIHIKVKEKKRFWLFSVEDNGIGIDLKHHKVIFDLFKRLHTNSHYEGTGIGLSFCKKIIEAHGGEICVKSSLHEGSQFSFTLPKGIGLKGRGGAI